MGGIKNGLLIMSFDDAMKQHSEAAICIASMWMEEIYEQIGKYDKTLLSRSWNLRSTMNWETSKNLFASTEVEYIQRNEHRFWELYNKLADDRSRSTLCGILNYRLTRNENYLKEIKSNEMIYLDRELFMDDEINKISSAVMIDGGSFDGDTVEMFLKVYRGSNLDIHCYEAEERNCIILREKLNEWKPNRVTVHEAALWSEGRENLYFDGNGLSGKASEEQTQSSLSVRDDYEYDDISFIKLDVQSGRH